VELTRRGFIEVAGASVLAGAAASTGAYARAPDGPNVLVIVVDTLRADHVGAYGGRARTPAIDSLAQAGLRFTRFYPEAMATLPARRSIMTGRRVFPFWGWRRWPNLGNTPGWAPIQRVDATFTSALARAGWWTGYVTDNPYLGFAPEYERFRRSFTRFVRFSGQLGATRPGTSVAKREIDRWLVPELRLPHIRARVRRFLAGSEHYWRDESRSFAARVFTAAAGALEEGARRRPFALVVDTYEPHEPWTPPRSYIDLYGDPDHRGPDPCLGRYMRVDDYLPAARRERVLRRLGDVYAAEVTMTDRWLGVLLERLGDLSLERETIVVLVSDHGHLLGEHGWTGKIASILHPPLIHVPLVLVDPQRRRAGGASAYFAQTHDLAPTILAMTGVPGPGSTDGEDLSPLLRDRRPPERRFAYGGYANWHYLRGERSAYVAANSGAVRRVYDLRSDPGESRDLARERPTLLDELGERVRERTGPRLPVYR
jgi:arylsulfatase A-like enzyme